MSGGSIEELGPGSVGVVGIGEGVFVVCGVGICDVVWRGGCDLIEIFASCMCNGVVSSDSGKASLSVGVTVVLMRRRPGNVGRFVVHLVSDLVKKVKLGSLGAAILLIGELESNNAVSEPILT